MRHPRLTVRRLRRWRSPPRAARRQAASALAIALGAHVAAGDGPLVVLLGEDGADEADDRGRGRGRCRRRRCGGGSRGSGARAGCWTRSGASAPWGAVKARMSGAGVGESGRRGREALLELVRRRGRTGRAPSRGRAGRRSSAPASRRSLRALGDAASAGCARSGCGSAARPRRAGSRRSRRRGRGGRRR